MSTEQPTVTITRPATLQIRFDMELEEFEPRQASILNELARMLGVSPNALPIIEMRRGCVIITVELPESAKEEAEKLLAGGKDEQALRDFFSRHAIKQFRINPTVEAPAVHTQTASDLAGLPFPQTGRTLTWVHLSDLHLRDGESFKQLQQSDVTHRLLKQFSGLLEQIRVQPDLFIFSGDIVFSGSDAQYDVARAFLHNLVQSISPAPVLLAIPGNHDIERGKIDVAVDQALRTQFKSNEDVSDYLSSTKDDIKRSRDNQFSRLHSFNRFFGSIALRQVTFQLDGLFWTYQNTLKDVSIGIAGLNSAWMCTKRSGIEHEAGSNVPVDMSELRLGEPQLLHASRVLEQSQLRIGVMHHPPMSNWFHRDEKPLHRRHLPQFDFVLRGHEHERSTVRIATMSDRQPWYEIAAPALYAPPRDITYQNGFNVVSLNLDHGIGVIYYFSFFRNSGVWRRDLEPAENGYEAFILPAPVVSRLKKKLQATTFVKDVKTASGTGAHNELTVPSESVRSGTTT